VGLYRKIENRRWECSVGEVRTGIWGCGREVRTGIFEKSTNFDV